MTPPIREDGPPIKHQSRRPLISGSHIRTWVPRGFAVVHSASPGTGLSQGCPTVGGANESLAPKAVIGLAARRVNSGRPLDHTEFSSGVASGQAVAVLRTLGFDVRPIEESVIHDERERREEIWRQLISGSGPAQATAG